MTARPAARAHTRAYAHALTRAHTRVSPPNFPQAVGDALSDLLLVDAILRVRGWGLGEWDRLYADLPSRQTKLTVRNRNVRACARARARERASAAPARERLYEPFGRARGVAPGSRLA